MNELQNELKLQDIFDMEVWQKIQDSFAEATGFAAIIVDKNGVPLLDYSNFSDYCLEVRKTNRCKFCFLSDATGGDLASKCEEPVIYQCHAGLIDFAVPIMVQGKYMGAILAGQARLSPEELDKDLLESIPYLHPASEDDGVPLYESSPEMRRLYDQTPIISLDRIKAASKLLYTLANHLAEMKLVNQMQNQLHEKEIELSEETRLRSEVEAALKEADLKALQSQLNPHFLFNVLNTIGRLALLENAGKTQELVYHFSDLMRYSLKRNSTDAVTIKEELDYVRHYLSIQEIRLGERLQYQIDADPGMDQLLCPSMIIQPFVENVINHVIEPRRLGGKILIKVKDIGKEIEIKISDNGEGIPEEKAKQILNGTYSAEGKSTGLGIVNVNKRLKYYYGAENGIKICRSPDNGTQIIMRIPKHEIEV